jgi:pimeloyl-ACP methyl ester carboxylesterase
MAKRCMAVAENGRIHFDYDMKIAEPMAAMPDGPAPDMWPAFKALAGRPVLLLRGEWSAVVAPDTFGRMARELPAAATVVVPGVGHAPLLDEPAALAALDAMLETAP